MKKNFLILLLAFSATVYGADTMHIELNTKVFKKGDTLEFKCSIPDFEKLKLQRATLNVWIEDVEKTHRWKYRYPMINGEVSAALAITDKIPDGRYAVNFLVQPGFLKVTGEIVAHDKKDTSIMYMMMLKNKKGTYIDNTPVAKDGSFRLKSTLFADSAFFVFTPAIKAKRNYLAIAIETPLDSAFTPVLYKTSFITVGDASTLGSKKADTTGYAFLQEESEKASLGNVTVTTKYKSKVQQFDAEYYSHGLFQNEGAILFDGIEKKDIARSPTILQFIVNNVTGLTQDPDGGIFWRQQPVQFYLDEFAVSPEDLVFISPADIAMIKAFRPPAHVGGDFDLVSGAIAVYTKKGTYLNDNKYRHSFIVKGYTNFESKWQ